MIRDGTAFGPEERMEARHNSIVELAIDTIAALADPAPECWAFFVVLRLLSLSRKPTLRR